MSNSLADRLDHAADCYKDEMETPQDFANLIHAAAAALRSMEWVSVEDELPPADTDFDAGVEDHWTGPMQLEHWDRKWILGEWTHWRLSTPPAPTEQL